MPAVSLTMTQRQEQKILKSWIVALLIGQMKLCQDLENPFGDYILKFK
jgi:hypothetical protein